MRALLQRVSEAEVFVDGSSTGRIGEGLLVYLGISPEDSTQSAEKTAEKVASLRIFNDSEGKLNLSVNDVDGAILVIPNFTLMGDARKGRRPSYNGSAPSDVAEPLFDHFVTALSRLVTVVERGVFGADMTIESTARGPVNVVVDITPECA